MTARTVVEDFDTIDQVIARLDSDAPEGSGNQSRVNGRDDSWDLGLGYDGAYDAYCGGWAEGAHKAQQLAATLAPRPRATRTALRRNVTGAFPNVGAHLAGAPNAMYQVSRKAAQGRPYVHLYLPITYAAFIEADTAFDHGCAMVAMVDALETAGCRVAITLVNAGALDKVRAIQRYHVKGYGDPLDIDQVIFTAAHPAFFRRLVFAMIERSEHKAWRDVTAPGRGYGSVTPLTEDDCPVDGNAVRVILPTLTKNGGTPESHLQEIVALLPDDLQTEITGA